MQTALDRLDKLHKFRREYPEMGTDAAQIESYANILKQNVRTLAYAIVNATDLARYSAARHRNSN